MKSRPEDDPILVDIVEKELQPFKRFLTPRELEFFRREALVQLSTHPYPAALLRQLHLQTENDEIATEKIDASIQRPTAPDVTESGIQGGDHDQRGAVRAANGRGQR